MDSVAKSDVPLFIDSDNALGSPSGDIDDAFAVAALLKSGTPIEALSGIFGNSSEPRAYENHKTLATLCEFNGKILRGAQNRRSGPTEASRYLAALDHKVRLVAIGPMTNVALALRERESLAEELTEVIFVGTNYSIPLPAFRFFDFNQWNDPGAMRVVFDSKTPLTCVPCNVARRLRLSDKELRFLPGVLGEHFRKHSARWFTRARFLKGSTTVPIWDLVAAIYALKPDLFVTDTTTIELGRMGQALFGSAGGRPIKVVTKFDSKQVWEYFLSLMAFGADGPVVT